MRLRLVAVCALSGLPFAAAAQDIGDPRAGSALAREVCAHCHAVWRGEARSPLPEAPGFEDLANVPGMTALALNVALQTSHKTMPDLVFKPEERADVIAYILSLKARGE